jgi:hypothetical protein
MSDRTKWKMLHLLHTLPPGVDGLTAQQLDRAGIDCGDDTIQPLVHGLLVGRNHEGLYSLSPASRAMLESCIVGNRRWPGKDMMVDEPEVFVIMPFSEDWSSAVFDGMIRPAVKNVELRCVRGDMPARVGDLTSTIWSALMRAGLIIADVSAPNPNVFYEIGLTHALGKDCFLLKETHSRVPADFGGSHYYSYDKSDLEAGRLMLEAHLRSWIQENDAKGVRVIAGM